MDPTTWTRLRAKIDHDLYRIFLDRIGCGPFDGGCVVFAQALQRSIGGKVVVLTRANGDADHAAVAVDDVLFDYDGPLEPAGFLRRFNANERASTLGFRPIESADLSGACWDTELEDELASLISSALAGLHRRS